MSQTAIDLTVGASLCLAVLSVGFVAGWRCRLATQSVIAPTWELRPLRSRGRAVTFSELLSHWHDIRPRLAELASGVREVQDAPCAAVAEWRSDLVALSKELHQALKRLLGKNGSIALKTNSRTTAANQEDEQPREVLTNEHLVTLLEEEPSTIVHGDVKSPAARRKFSAMQVLAPLPDDGGLPSTVSEVQCHDVSVRDIRYFVDKLPSTDRVLIGLGLPSPVKWVVAEIENYRRVVMYGRTGYLVTARFIGAAGGSRGQSAEVVRNSEQEAAV